MSGLEALGVVGFAISLPGNVRTARQLLRKVKERIKSVGGNQELCEELEGRFEKLERNLGGLRGAGCDEISDVCRDTLAKIESYFKESSRDLEKLLKTKIKSHKASARPSQLYKGGDWAKKLREMKDGLDALEPQLLQLDQFTEMKKEFSEVKVGMEEEGRKSRKEMKRMREEMTERLGNLGSSSVREVFRASFRVPDNPWGPKPNLGDTSTPEGRLKEMLMRGDAPVVAAVSESAMAAVGMGGVGKTFALREIGRDEEVTKHFTDGVYWLSLGQDATDATVIDQVAKAVKDSNGKLLSDKIRQEGRLNSAVDDAAKWFAGRCCLFLCDDLWRSGSKVEGYFYELKSLLDTKSGSRMLCSTRDQGIARLTGEERKIQFTEREPEEAKRIICGYANFEPRDIDGCDLEVREAFEFVLEKCGGLPLALCLAGRAVRNLADKAQTEAWKVYKRRIESVKGRELQLIKESAAKYTGGLFFALLAGLGLVSDRLEGGASAEKLLRALCVLQKQEWAPSSMLARLWGAEDDVDAERITEEFANLSIVDMECGGVESNKVVGLKIHDLVHDFCVATAIREEGLAFWHEALLKGYWLRTSESGKVGGPEGAIRQWWTKSIVDDGYIHKNVSRHLAGCKSFRELQGLLLDFQWTERQLEVSGVLGLEQDFRTLIENLPDDGMSRDRKIRELKMIVDAVRLSWPCLLKSEDSNQVLDHSV